MRLKRLMLCIRNDMFLQLKYGIYFVYGIITLVYIFILKKFPSEHLGVFLPFIIFSDPSVLGFFFVGGLVLLEKGENIIEYLISTPLKIKEYIYSKVISLTILSILTSIIIVSFTYGINFGIFFFSLGIMLTSFFFTLVGFIAVSRFQTVNEYILSSIVYITILFLPILDFFGIYKSWIFYLIPTQASLILIKSGFYYIKTWELLYAVGYLGLFILILSILAYRSFYNNFVLKKGRI